MERDIGGLAAERWDLLVIGGGVTGAWVARDAALRGLRVALVEREDFGGGTSSQCFRTIHGGLRYLQHLDLRRSRESIRERSMWLRVAPHLVEPLPFVIPTYRRGLHRRPLLRAATMVSDAIGWDRNRDLDPNRRLPPGRMIDRGECLGLVPEADAPDLTGGVVFHDAVMYSPERLVLEVVLGAAEAGAGVANYVEVEELAEVADGFMAGCRDVLSGDRFRIKTRAVVNATGGQAYAVARDLGVREGPAPVNSSIALSLVVDSLGHNVAFATQGRQSDPDAVLKIGARRLFVLPWRGRSLVGTAHYPIDGDSDIDVDRFVERFLGEVNAPGTGLHIALDDVAAVQWGVLPALASPEPDGGVRLLKHHRIVDHSESGMPGVFSIVSVKFTTGRLAAEQAVDRVFRFLEYEPPPCRTSMEPLPGGAFYSLESLRHRIVEQITQLSLAVDADVVEHLTRTYGSRYSGVLQEAATNPDLLQRVQPAEATIRAQLVFGLRTEMARTAADLIQRRTDLGARGSVSDRAWDVAEAVVASADSDAAPLG